MYTYRFLWYWLGVLLVAGLTSLIMWSIWEGWL